MNVRDAKGNTPMHIIAKNGNKRILNYILDKNPIISTCNNDGKTPSHIATLAPIKIVRFIMNYFNNKIDYNRKLKIIK